MSEEVINLPYGYKRCLFLQSSGTQYINTNHVATINTGAYVEWSLNAIKNYSNILCSIGTSSDTNADCIFMIPHWNGDNNAYLTSFISRASGGFRLENQELPNLYSRYSSKLNYFNNKSAYINDTLMGTFETEISLSANDLPLYLFGCNKLNSLSTADSMIGRIYRATITEDEEVVMDLIPCLDDKGKPCMYDLVTQTPFYNANAEGNDFKYVVKGKMPSWYKRVKYLESTGTQYIKTGYVPTNTTGLYIDTQDVGSGDTIPMGSWNSTSTNTRFFITRQTAAKTAGYGWGSWNQISSTTGSVRYDSTLNWLNDRKSITNNPLFSTIIKNLGELPFIPQYDIWMFGVNHAESHAYKFKGRIYRAKISEGSEVVRDFVPAYDTEQQRPCMYDLVDGRAYYNAGTGEFNYPLVSQETNYTGFCQLGVIGNRLGGGEDGLPPTYKRVNYLRSTGTQYIDTGIVTDGTYTISTKFCIDEIKGNHGIWGRDINNDKGSSYAVAFKPSTYALHFSSYWNGGLYDWMVDIFQPHEYIVTEGQKSIIVDGETKALKALNTCPVNSSNPYNLPHYLFRRSQMYSFISFYNFRMENGEGKVVLDFIPCLNDNGRPCMFDRISNKTFYNKGTGEFLYG